MIKTFEAFIADIPSRLAAPARILLHLIPRLIAPVRKAVEARRDNGEAGDKSGVAVEPALRRLRLSGCSGVHFVPDGSISPT